MSHDIISNTPTLKWAFCYFSGEPWKRQIIGNDETLTHSEGQTFLIFFYAYHIIYKKVKNDVHFENWYKMKDQNKKQSFAVLLGPSSFSPMCI